MSFYLFKVVFEKYHNQINSIEFSETYFFSTWHVVSGTLSPNNFACPTKILHHLTLVFWDTIYKLEITCSIIADCCITSMPRIMYIEAMQVTFTHQGYTEAGVVTKSNWPLIPWNFEMHWYIFYLQRLGDDEQVLPVFKRQHQTSY